MSSNFPVSYAVRLAQASISNEAKIKVAEAIEKLEKENDIEKKEIAH